jgi:hypothetical protein
MKKLLIVSAFLLTLTLLTPALIAYAKSDGLDSSNGVDVLRGAWGGIMVRPDGSERQINFYFEKFAADPDNPGYDKMPGSFSNDELNLQKRAKAPELPMMAWRTAIDDSIFEVIILATYLIPPDMGGPMTTVVKFEGQVSLGNSDGINDDTMGGIWYAGTSEGAIVEGPWHAVHLDRRHVSAPEVDLEDPTIDLFFHADAYASLSGPASVPPEERGACTILGVSSNIVMDSVRVTKPDGTSIILPPYTDVFSLGVDWVTLFRFSTCDPGMPVAGGTYIFTALDASGDPIPGVEVADVWVGVEAPDPPSNVAVTVVDDDGVMVTWDDVPIIPGSFEPASDPQLGFYQMGINGPEPEWESVYGANFIADPFHLVPRDKADFVPGQDHGMPLDEMVDGTYVLGTCVHSMAPEGSLGHGFEYNNSDPEESILFTIIDGVITILP